MTETLKLNKQMDEQTVVLNTILQNEILMNGKIDEILDAINYEQNVLSEKLQKIITIIKF